MRERRDVQDGAPKDVCDKVLPAISSNAGLMGVIIDHEHRTLLRRSSPTKGILMMPMQMICHGSIMRSARSLFPALYLVIAMVVCSLMPLALPTASAEVQEDFRLWGNVTARGNFGIIDSDLKRWRWWMEVQPRSRESGKEMDQLLIRPGIGYALTDHSTVWIGYAHVTNYPIIGNDEIEESRIWQQYQWSGPTLLGKFTSRTRFEQRWQENGDDTGGRFRQFFKFNWPFWFHPAASFVAWDEMFVHLNSTDWGARQGFDQNRGFAGLGYRWTPQILSEVGYLNQYINTANTDRMNHILSLNLFLDF